MAGATNFPGSADDFAEASPTNLGTEDASGRTHSERHDDMEAAMEAVQAYVLALSPTVYVSETEPGTPSDGDLWVVPTYAAPLTIGVVQHAQNWTYGTSTVVSVSSTAAGSTLVAICSPGADTDGGAVTDSAGGTWTLAENSYPDGSTTGRHSSLWYRIGASAGVTSVTLTIDSTQIAAMNVFELSNVASYRGGASTFVTSAAKSVSANAQPGDMILAGLSTVMVTTPYAGSVTDYTEVAEMYHAASNANTLMSCYRLLGTGDAGGIQGPTWTATGLGSCGLTIGVFQPDSA